eukprot:5201379-Amphidinium_carterae.1
MDKEGSDVQRSRISCCVCSREDKQAPEAPQPMKMTLELDTLCPSALQSTVKSVAGTLGSW